MYYVVLKPDHKLALQEVEIVGRLGLRTPEKRWPFPEDKERSELIEVFKSGSKASCEKFIRKKIKRDWLKSNFHIIKR